MDKAQLNAFVSSAKYQSFSRAAQTLHLSQSAVSKRIASLESTLNVRLFDRIGREVLLTEAGRVFLPHAQMLLAAMLDSVTELNNLAGQVSGRLRLGSSHHIGLHRLPPILKQFSQRYPSVDMQLCFMESEAACLAVASGELEIALVTLPQTVPTSLDHIVVWQDPLLVVIANDHPALHRLELQTTLTRAAGLTELPAILPESDSITRRIIEQAFSALGLSLKVGLTTDYLETIKMLVRVGLGWSVLPERMLDQSLHALDIPELPLSRRLGVVWHRQRSLTNASRQLLKLLQADVS